MKIVTFQTRKTESALFQTRTDADELLLDGKRIIPNRFTAFGYNDRFLWEEAASLRPQPKKEFCIPGNWQ